MVHNQLAAPGEQVREALAALCGIEGIGLLFFQQRTAGAEPLLRGNDAVRGHGDSLLCGLGCDYLARAARLPRARVRSALGCASICSSAAARVSNCSCQYLL